MLSKETEDDQRWLKYWILVSVFLTLQIPGDCVLGWAPGFGLAKIAFLLWCMAPIQENGSVVLFQKVSETSFEKVIMKIILILFYHRRWSFPIMRSTAPTLTE